MTALPCFAFDRSGQEISGKASGPISFSVSERQCASSDRREHPNHRSLGRIKRMSNGLQGNSLMRQPAISGICLALSSQGCRVSTEQLVHNEGTTRQYKTVAIHDVYLLEKV